MADLIAYQSGNWTGATTWKGVATGTDAKLDSGSYLAFSLTNTVIQASANFTIGDGTVCEGILLHGYRLSTAGTVTVSLYLGNTLQRAVTVNASDLPAVQSWLFFKFASTVTAGAGTTYNIRFQSSVDNTVRFAQSGALNNVQRYIRTSTTATAAASDVTFICAELTGAGAKTDITVTMDSTASTTYGACNIGFSGALSYGTSASTNYILDLGGNLNVWAGGTLNIGTSGTPIPSTSTAVLEFTNAVNVDRGLEVKSGGTCNLYGATKSNTKALLTSNAASGQRVFTIASTTGWAANDVVVLGATSFTPSHSEKGTVSSVDSATQITLVANLTQAHTGVAPYVGEVMNLTRNVKVRGTSQTLCAYVLCADTSSFTASYAEFSWLGSGTTGKTGVESNTTSAGTFTMSFCSIYDVNANARGLYILSGSGSPTVEDCTLFLTGGNTSGIQQATSGTPSFQRNYVMTHGAGFSFLDLGGTIMDNRFVGPSLQLNESGATIGTIKDNLVRTTNAAAVDVVSPCFGTIDGFTVWNNYYQAFGISNGGFTLANCVTYNNDFLNLGQLSITSTHGLTLVNCTIGNATLDRTCMTVNYGKVVAESSTFSGTTSLVTIGNNTSGAVSLLFRKCVFDGNLGTVISSQSAMMTAGETESYVAFEQFNNASLAHRRYKTWGYTASDQTTFRTSPSSEALLPNSATNKLTSSHRSFAVADATTATVTVYVYKSATYNGNQPRLMMKANSVAVGGVFTDTVLATAVGGTDSWLTLTGTTESVDDNCVIDVYVDCDGTAGTVYVDDWSIS